ncbi:hypothetical protein [Edaphobacter albus]|uniref:hypothetical protein n=1 Tax=Edaphobacter sp. 4G125 TaxID=2763071 RepID=UPI001646E81D|nr:hypothetical protein [Edaphobacter sp. 4G125]QNI36593.1 hypothetical protein H7846_16825 [Edaphobacter sp. 4G125]
MKIRIAISLFLIALTSQVFGQAAPTATLAPVAAPTPAGATAPRLSWLDGTIHYAVNAAEIVQYGYYGAGNTTSSTAISGVAGYSSLSQVHPTSLLFSGGVVFGQGGQGTTTYQNFAISQSLIKGLWVFNVADSFSFLPQSPVTGVAGVPGINNPGSTPIDGPSQGPAGGILTYTGNRISNMINGTVERRLTGRTSISGTGMWSVLHFIDKNAGLDTSMLSGQVGLNHQINARNTASISALYSTFDTTNLLAIYPPGFPNNDVTYQTKGINVSYQRLWTRALSTDISAGPMWIQTSAAQLIPDRLNYSLSAGANYNRQLTNYSLRYMHGVNGGSGVQPGALSDAVSASVGRTFNPKWAASASFVYTRTSGLLVVNPALGSVNGITNTEYGTLQVTHGFTRTFSGYASYTAQNQSTNQGILLPNAFNGLSHIFGIGVSWTPQSTRLGDF